MVTRAQCVLAGIVIALLSWAPGARASDLVRPPLAPGVRYYGLWDQSARDIGTEWSIEYIRRTAPFSNVVFISPRLGYDPSTKDDWTKATCSFDQLGTLLPVATNAKLKVIITLDSFPGFYGPRFDTAAMSHCIRDLAQFLSSAGATGSVAAFFLPDEPYDNNRDSMALPVTYDAYGNGISRPDSNPSIYERLDYVARRLHESFPGVPVASNTGADQVPGYGLFGYESPCGDPYNHCYRYQGIEYPDSIDWVGMDLYLWRSGDWDDVRLRLDYILARKKPHQMLFLIPDAWNPGRRFTEDAIVERVRRFEAYAASHPEVVGVFPYYYWTGLENSSWCFTFIAPDTCWNGSAWFHGVADLGLRDLPAVMAEHVRWGQALTHKDVSVSTAIVVGTRMLLTR